MNFKENVGLDPVTLDRGYTKLDGDPPNSGENIFKPQHIQREKMMTMLDSDEAAEDVGGFLEREIPEYYERPNRACDVDRG